MQPDGVLVHPGAVDLVVDVLDQAVHLPPRLESDQLSLTSEANQAPLLPITEARVSWVVDFIFVACSCITENSVNCSGANMSILISPLYWPEVGSGVYIPGWGVNKRPS